jgi:hypothetical protein
MTPQVQEEQWIFDSFIRLYSDETISKYTKAEAPDFIIDLGNRKVGLELTEIFQDSGEKKDSELQRRSSDRKTFTEDFIAELQPRMNFNFMVGIHFRRLHSIKKSEKKHIISKLVTICAPKLAKLQNKENLEIDYSDGVPEQIQTLNFLRYDGLRESMNSQPEGGAVGELTSELLQTIIDKKQKKLPTYLPCDEYWLLIREGNYYAGSFSDEIEKPLIICSAFDKVFLLRTKKNELISLKLISLK